MHNLVAQLNETEDCIVAKSRLVMHASTLTITYPFRTSGMRTELSGELGSSSSRPNLRLVVQNSAMNYERESRHCNL